MTTIIKRVLGVSVAAAMCLGYTPTKAEAGLPKNLRKLFSDSDGSTRQKTTQKAPTVGCHNLSSDTLQQKANPYHSTIAKAAQRYGVSANLVKAVITIESCFKPNARGSSGEKGLMQLMPGTARRFNIRNGYSANQSINGGARYLSLLVNRYAGNLHRAVAAYNAGEGNVGHSGSIPNVGYVGKVMHAYNKFATGNGPASVEDAPPVPSQTAVNQPPASHASAKPIKVATAKHSSMRFHLPTVRLNHSAQPLAQHKYHAQHLAKKTGHTTTIATRQATPALPWADKVVGKKS